jgi:hypothetical protein
MSLHAKQRRFLVTFCRQTKSYPLLKAAEAFEPTKNIEQQRKESADKPGSV